MCRKNVYKVNCLLGKKEDEEEEERKKNPGQRGKAFPQLCRKANKKQETINKKGAVSPSAKQLINKQEKN